MTTKTTVNTNSGAFKETFKAFIIASCAYEDFDLNPDTMTDNDKINFIYERFNKEAYQWQTGKNRQRVFADWLQGLALHVPFYYRDIIALAISWGTLSANATEKQQMAICENYWNFLAFKFLQLHSSINK